MKNIDGADVRLLLLGPMQVHVGNRQVEITARKARALLAYLALRHGEAVPRETLAGLFWGDRNEEQARASLRQTLSTIRKALGGEGAKSLITSNENATLVSDEAWVDMVALEKNVDASGADDLEDLANLYRGELLEGLTLKEPEFDQWLTSERERARSLIFRVLSRLIERMEQDHRVEEAITYGTMLLAMDPLQEHIHCKLMRLYMAQGRYDVALNQFEQCRREPGEQLNVTPQQASLDIVKEVRSRRRQASQQTMTAPEPTVAGLPDSTGSPPESSSTLNATLSREPLTLPDKPSLAVLPFANMVGDIGQEYFSDGITEDIITELSRFHSLFVIARNSSFSYKGQTADVKQM